MTHIKNMLKYLLITIMALSLLAVSCKKDGTPPTNPITIDAATLDSAIQSAGANAKFTGATIDFSTFKSASGNANLVATTTAEVTLNTLKTELESALNFSSGGVTATAAATVPATNNVTDAVTVKVELDAVNNTFADDVKTAYNVTDKKATVEITIKTGKNNEGLNMNWNNQPSKTINAATLDAAIKKEVDWVGLTHKKSHDTDDEVGTTILTIDFSKFKSEGGEENLTAKIDLSLNHDNMGELKTKLESALSFSSDGVTFTPTVTTTPDINTASPLIVKVEIDARNNTFADDVKTAYKDVTDKKATVEIKIKPNGNKKWDGTT